MKYSYSDSLRHMLAPYLICAIFWFVLGQFQDPPEQIMQLFNFWLIWLPQLLFLFSHFWSIIPLFMTLIGIQFHYFSLPIGVQKVINVGRSSFAISIVSNKILVILDSGQVQTLYLLGLSYQDFRYEEFQNKINNRALYWIFSFLAFHIYPTIIVYLGYIPLYYVITNYDEHNCLFEVGMMISAIGVVIQWIADYQLYPFRAKLKTGNCEVGLWNYCRHPNYLGECLLWWGMYVSVLSFGVSYYKLGIGALGIQIMFLTYSIPNMENHLQKTRKAYSIYQKEVNSFIPWFRRESKKN